MSTLNPEQWKIVSPYLDQALSMPEAEREAWVRLLGEKDPELATQLSGLLDEHRLLEQSGFLEDDLSALAKDPGLAGLTIGPYRLISQIGQGGMGSVWLAERSDGRYERRVAVKFLNLALMGKGARSDSSGKASFLVASSTSTSPAWSMLASRLRVNPSWCSSMWKGEHIGRLLR